MNFFQRLKDHYQRIEFPGLSISIFALLAYNRFQKMFGEKIKIIKSNKPCIIFDIENFFIKKKLTLFGYEYHIRNNAPLFLFHLARIYDLVCISKLQINIDPYGCIRQKIWTTQKDKIDGDIDLKKTIVISTGDKFHEKFDNNVLILPKYKNEKYSLMSLLDFFYFLEKENDYRKILKRYKNLPFFEYFGKVKYRNFRMRNLLAINPLNKYLKYLKSVDDERINEYNQAKNFMDSEIKNMKETSIWRKFLKCYYK
ncbi:Mitochondrial import inner membrane translocase subunit tim50 [Dictyocoela muelleri]|nr:Mitochondrial import inner membrane translocase subunit tim50 [Dictyocoela muelleri]